MIILYSMLAIFALILVLLVIVFVIIRSARNSKAGAPAPSLSSFETLMQTLKNKNSTASQMDNALSTIIKKYGTIKSHAEFETYKEIIVAACRHPHITSKIILDFDSRLAKRNPSYRKEINKVIREGLNSREV
jgi:hypothetical protein